MAKRKIWFCLFAAACGLSRSLSVHESGVREQSEMSYGAQDGVWKSYFIFLVAFLSFLLLFLPFPCSVIRNMFYRFLLGFMARRERQNREKNCWVKNCHFRNVWTTKAESMLRMESGFVYWGCWDLGSWFGKMRRIAWMRGKDRDGKFLY